MNGGIIIEGEWLSKNYITTEQFEGTWKHKDKDEQIVNWCGKWNNIVDKDGNKEYRGILEYKNKKYSIIWTGTYISNVWDGTFKYLPEYIAELYEFEIKNYSNSPDSDNYEFIFDEFGENKNNCGEIKTKRYPSMIQTDPTNINYRKSCDIVSDKISDNIEYLNFDNVIIQGMYDVIYLKKNSKESINKNKGDKFNIIYCDDILEKVNSIKNIYQEKFKKIITVADDFKNESYILKVNFDEKQKIIVIGDIHGSFHTLFRLLVRFHFFKILDLNTFIINDGYTIIFLGDIVDRGSYQIECLYLIFNLLYKNLDDNYWDCPKIIYNRGNHEEIITNHYYGLNEEISNKCGHIPEKNNFNELYLNINFLFEYFPVAVIINNIYWLCHGGIPYYIDKPDFFKNLKENFNNIITIDRKTASQIMWNDFHGNDNTIISPRGDKDNIFYYIGKEYLKTFLNSGFKFIIRGHNDSFSNSWLLTKSFIEVKESLCYNTADNDKQDILNILEYNEPNTKNRYYGKLILEDPKIFGNDEILPVLTISTNTGNGRKLNRDSYILLRVKI